MRSNAGLVNNIYKNEGFSSLCRASSLCSCPMDCEPLCLPRHMQETLLSEIIYLACFPSTLPPPFCFRTNPRPYPLFTMDAVARASVVPILTLQLFLYPVPSWGTPGFLLLLWSSAKISRILLLFLSLILHKQEWRAAVVGNETGGNHGIIPKNEGVCGAHVLLTQVTFVYSCALPPSTERHSLRRGSF